MRAISGAALVALVALAAGRPARACSPSNHRTQLVPETARVYPANAAIVSYGYAASDGAVLTVDGQPAIFTEDPEFAGWKPPLIVTDRSEGLRPVEEPAVGAQVVWTWQPFSGCGEPLAYTVGPPDVTPPAPPTALWFDLHDYPEGYGGSCSDPADLTYWVHVQGPPQDDGSPIMLLIRGEPTNFAVKQWFKTFVPAAPGTVVVSLPAWSADLGDIAPAEALCFTVFAVDLAGNSSAEGLKACLPCHVSTVATGVDDPDEFDDVVEPAWSDAKLWPDGQCVAEPVGGGNGETTGGETTGVDVTTGTDSGELPGTSGDTTGPADETTTTTGSPETGTGQPTGGVEPTTSGGGSTGNPGSPATAGDDGQVDRGCACEATAGEPAWLAVFVPALVRRRRRARSGLSRAGSG